MKRIVITFILALTFTSAFAKSELQFYAYTEILNSGQLIATPSLLLPVSGESAEISAGQLVEGEDVKKYTLSLSASPSDEGYALLKINLDVGGESIIESKVVEVGKKTSIAQGELSVIIKLNEY